MAAAEQQQQQLNGSSNEQYNGEFNPDFVNNDDEDSKKFRPPDIDADVREMERRRRVEMIMGRSVHLFVDLITSTVVKVFVLNSRTFRDDLERIVDQQISGAAGLFAIQQHISDITGIG